MDPKIKTLLSQDFLSFARKAILELEGTKIGKEPYLKYLACELDQFANEETRRLIINLDEDENAPAPEIDCRARCAASQRDPRSAPVREELQSVRLGLIVTSDVGGACDGGSAFSGAHSRVDRERRSASDGRVRGGAAP